MATRHKVSPLGIIRENDTGTLATKRTYGGPDFDSLDYLDVVGNGSALVSTTDRVVQLNSNNDASGVDNVSLQVTCKGKGVLIIPKMATPPTGAAAYNGGIYYDTDDNKFYGCSNGSWVVLGSQS